MGMIFDVVRNSYVDGPGIRTAVFFKGCNLSCAWCHNPESQKTGQEMLFYRRLCVGCGKCREKCTFSGIQNLAQCRLCGECALYCPRNARKICGWETTAEEVFRVIRKDKDFYRDCGGVTFSGGECMLQLDFLTELLTLCKKDNISTAVDTAGNVPYSSFARILPLTDLFLYDIKIWDEAKHRQYTGVSNQLILDNLSRLLNSGARVLIRIPVLKGINDSAEEAEQIKKYLASLPPVLGVELLPYHAMGESKYEALGRTPRMFSPPGEEQLEMLRGIFR
ncbi:MAG: glycyl-radical enzyme activating protein [Clostridia bacterium]|nr:glycyl-radical enzyme activating protein [Clostridia bacterium]